MDGSSVANKNVPYHTVPMSEAMVKVYEAVAATRSSGYLFSGRLGDCPIASSAVASALHRIGIDLHGWRAIWRDWAAELGDIPRDVAEFQLGHVIGGTEGAYRRMSSLEARKLASEKYSRWLQGEEAGSNILSFPALKTGA
jgi:integrase